MGYLTGKEIIFPLCQKGKRAGIISESSPFSKEGPRPARHRSRSGEAGGGILLRARLPEDHRSILTLQAKLNYTTSTADVL